MGEENSITSRRGITSLAGIAILVGLYFASRYNFLVFHVLAEGFSIAVACGIFMVAWNARRFLGNTYFLLMGMAFLFIGSVDLLHTMAYRGIDIFPGYDSNLPTQLWLAGRYLQSITFLIAPLFIGRKIWEKEVLALYAAVFVLLTGMVFSGYFPTAFVEGHGLTPFKKISEYVISLILVGSLFTLRAQKDSFDPKVLRLLYWATALSIASELAFTFYVSVYGFSNLVGHYLKLLAFVLIYRALVVTGLREPYSLLFRDLKRSEEKYRSLFNNMINGFAYHRIITDDNGKPIDYMFLEVNDAFQALTGLRKADIIGQRVTEVLPGTEKDPADWIGVYGRVALTGESVSFEQHAEALGRWYAVSAYSPEKEYFVVLFEDITERKRAEEELRIYREHLEELVKERTYELQAMNTLLEVAGREPLRNEYLKEVVDLMQALSGCRCVGIRIIGDEGNIPYGAYVGFSREFWESENMLSLEGDHCVCTRVMRGALGPETARCATPHGSFYSNDTYEFIGGLSEVDRPKFRGVCVKVGFKSLAVIPISHEGRIAAAIHLADEQAGKVPLSSVEFIEKLTPLIGEAVHKLELKQKLDENLRELMHTNDELEQQIAERERAEAQLLQSQKMEAVGVLAGGIAHDFNNRLFAIRNYAQILRSTADEREAETIDKLVVSCDRAAQLVDDLLRFSRKKAINPKPVDANGIVAEAKGILEIAAGKRVELRLSLYHSPLQVMADTSNIEHVLLNLVNNARDAMPEGGRITVSTRVAEADAVPAGEFDGGQSCTCAVISVSDTGPGLDERTKEKIFDPFFTTKEIGKGTGLGLSIVYGVIKQHGGFVDVISEPDMGTTFRMFLPLLK